MIVAVPVTGDGLLDPRWGRAQRVAIAEVRDGEVVRFDPHDVGWADLHDAGSEGGHHARIARFLRDEGVDAVVADHMGGGMRQMLAKMGVRVVLGASGEARAAVVDAVDEAGPQGR